ASRSLSMSCCSLLLLLSRSHLCCESFRLIHLPLIRISLRLLPLKPSQVVLPRDSFVADGTRHVLRRRPRAGRKHLKGQAARATEAEGAHEARSGGSGMRMAGTPFVLAST